MDHYEINFTTEKKNTEPLIALLAELDFDAFQETEIGFDTWIPQKEFNSETENSINNLKSLFSFSFEKKIIKYQNWNAVWESGFQPIIIKDFCGIRATFHEPLANVEHEIVIDPKMAFGTGHHETTFMMIEMMQMVDFKHKKVFDFGCGTGILAILAERLGATELDAIDIELPSYENSLENTRINQTKNIEIYHGTLPKLTHKKYDIILANINRHVILDSFSTLNNMLSSEGILIISGILTTDQKLVESNATKAGFKTITTLERNNWICSKLISF